jgi:hypothetical protein
MTGPHTGSVDAIIYLPDFDKLSEAIRVYGNDLSDDSDDEPDPDTLAIMARRLPVVLVNRSEGLGFASGLFVDVLNNIGGHLGLYDQGNNLLASRWYPTHV